MRTAILFLSAASLLAACSESADSTAPRSSVSKAPPVAAAAVAPQATSGSVNAARNASGPSVTYLTSPFVNIDGVTFISNVATVTCPSGTSIVGGGYEFSFGQMHARVAYNGPVGTNAWKVLVYGESAWASSFRVFGTCIG
jgi:hypothetical protein